ncbi:MAG: hypothetical protein ABGY41_22650 [Candidatus Poribacteria bacterium]
MTLPNDDVINYLDSRFILFHRNIENDKHVGMSQGYKPTQSAVGTTNGAGPRNVQFLILACDETVLHALPGFWHAEDLIPELQLAFEINRLYLDQSKDAAQKDKMFARLHKSHMRRHGAAAERRGHWQGFDRRAEMSRVQLEERDTFRKTVSGELELKSVPEVIHDRMLQRRFKKLDEFDLENFVPQHDARRFELGTPSLPTIHTALGGQEIIDEVGISAIYERNRMLTAHVVTRALESGFELTTAPDPDDRSAIVMIRNADPPAAVARLAEQGVIVDHRPGHVRVSPHFYNTTDEIDRCIDALSDS